MTAESFRDASRRSDAVKMSIREMIKAQEVIIGRIEGKRLLCMVTSGKCQKDDVIGGTELVIGWEKKKKKTKMNTTGSVAETTGRQRCAGQEALAFWI